MDILDIPELLEVPDPTPHDADPVAIADFLMTMLLRRQPAMLHAEFRDGDGRWFVQTAQSDECVFESKQLAVFRAVLARFGHHYMSDQLYGGYTRCVLSQRSQKFGCRIFMSNEGASGFWIRVYAHAAA